MLLVQPFELSALRLGAEGRPVPFAEHVDQFSTSTTGVLAYREKETLAAPPLGWMDRSGKIISVFEGLTAGASFSISPSGREVATSQSGDIWVGDLSRGVVSRFTFDPGEDTFPIWSPDGSRIVFLSNRNGQKGIYQKPANVAGTETLFFAAPRLEAIESWSPDGRLIVYTSRDDKGKSTVSILPVEGDRKPIVLPSMFNLRQARISPDGRWLAYVSDEDGKDQIYVQPFPSGESKWQVSNDGGTDPKWSRDGRELFYASREKMLMSVAIGRRDSSLELGPNQPLLRMPRGPYDTFDNRFLIPAAAAHDPPIDINIVIKWAAEIQRP
jgi:dipeptidyl aminopeptidase/acylaminoacyl peptidase